MTFGSEKYSGRPSQGMVIIDFRLCLGCKRSLVQIQSRRPTQLLRITWLSVQSGTRYRLSIDAVFNGNYWLMRFSIRRNIRRIVKSVGHPSGTPNYSSSTLRHLFNHQNNNPAHHSQIAWLRMAGDGDHRKEHHHGVCKTLCR